MIKRLSDLVFGEKGIVREINAEKSQNRLMELGFVPGAEIMAKNHAPFSGPIIYIINTMQIGLDKTLANQINVEVTKD